MSVNGKDGHYDAVIVGSGFGGSVTAYRLAQAGKSVCVLERGRAYPPVSFTRQTICSSLAPIECAASITPRGTSRSVCSTSRAK